MGRLLQSASDMWLNCLDLSQSRSSCKLHTILRMGSLEMGCAGVKRRPTSNSEHTVEESHTSNTMTLYLSGTLLILS
ncbi:hypothetical protein KIN20_010599 [Parelaphostrongylus tenuis]|uniref:Uncharacterized protein n=1 Tax=Parelaphostrongylus tenuis TaxID=148309 RepID=A0AAD5MCR7_PARTN|nr:hypothetical protein KIN20_010599 [Parelaphostrongylus tenuis]